MAIDEVEFSEFFASQYAPLCWLGYLLTGSRAEAEELAQDALVRTWWRWKLVHRPDASEGLQGLAAVAAVHGDDHRAARLVGAATAHRYGHPQERVEERLYARFLAPARARHGADRWDTAVREGSALSFEDAIAFALQERRA